MNSLTASLRLCLELAACFLIAGIWFLVVHVPTRAPARLAHLNRQQRKRRVRSIGWTCLMLSAASLVGAILYYIEIP